MQITPCLAWHSTKGTPLTNDPCLLFAHQWCHGAWWRAKNYFHVLSTAGFCIADVLHTIFFVIFVFREKNGLEAPRVLLSRALTKAD